MLNKYRQIIIFRAYKERPDYQNTVHGINKAKCAIENSLSRNNGFDFLQMKEIIEEIIKEEDYKSREAERYILSEQFRKSFT